MPRHRLGGAAPQPDRKQRRAGEGGGRGARHHCTATRHSTTEERTIQLATTTTQNKKDAAQRSSKAQHGHATHRSTKSHTKQGRLYKVRWKGFAASRDSWEPPSSFVPRYTTVWMDYLRKKNISLDVKDVLVHLVAAAAPQWIPLGIYVCLCAWETGEGVHPGILSLDWPYTPFTQSPHIYFTVVYVFRSVDDVSLSLIPLVHVVDQEETGYGGGHQL